jgi:hypothetical protein
LNTDPIQVTCTISICPEFKKGYLTLLKKGFVTPNMMAGRAEQLLAVISLKSASWMV